MSRVRGEGSPEVGGSTVLGRTRVMKRGPREAAGCPQGTRGRHGKDRRWPRSPFVWSRSSRARFSGTPCPSSGLFLFWIPDWKEDHAPC